MSGATIAPALPAMQAHFADTPNAALLVKLALTILGIVIAVTAPLFGCWPTVTAVSRCCSRRWRCT